MAEAKFTKGPWKLCSGNKASSGICTCHTISAENFPIAVVDHGEWGDRYPSLRFVDGGPGSLNPKVEAYMEFTPYGAIPEYESTANARLIVAAPDMYDVCLEAANHLYTEQDFERVSEMARKVISKARGEATA